MLDWILILTLVYAGDAAHISTVEFRTEAACKSAGVAWLQIHESKMGRKSAICVHR
jgi:hypothetical protein